MPSILFIISDTGGGHRAAAQAIMGAIAHLVPDGRVETSMIDFFAELFPPPFNRVAGLYGPMVNKADWAWHLGFRLTAKPPMGLMLNYVERGLSGRATGRMLRERRPDLIVSVHPLATEWMARVARRALPGVPFVTVVTDLATMHPNWFSRSVELTIVPSEVARKGALARGLNPDRVEVHGQPIDLRFASLPDQSEAAALKASFGANPARPLVMLVGGGEGMGRLEEHAVAASQAGVDVTLMAIAGRNEAMRQRLEERRWPIPVIVSGFVRDMPQRMVAADAILTKAGPGTICEALAAGLPLMITGYVPGQEEGNVSWVVDNGAGRRTFDRTSIQSTLRDLFPHGERSPTHRRMSASALKLARPKAALTIAERLLGFVGISGN